MAALQLPGIPSAFRSPEATNDDGFFNVVELLGFLPQLSLHSALRCSIGIE